MNPIKVETDDSYPFPVPPDAPTDAELAALDREPEPEPYDDERFSSSQHHAYNEMNQDYHRSVQGR